MAFSEQFSFPVVNTNALQIYKVALSNWGNMGASKDQNSVISPIFKFSLGGLAIDPESLITSVIVRPVKGGTLDPTGVATPDDFVIDKNLPFTGRLTFPRRGPYDGTWGLVAFRGDRFFDTATGPTGIAVPFGGAVPEFVKPELRVLMYGDSAPPPAGVPLRTGRRVDYTADQVGPKIITIEPISGRRIIRVTGAPTNGPGHSFRFLGVTAGSPVPNSNVEFENLATTMVTGAAAAAGAVKSQLIVDPTCHWLLVEATSNGALAPGDATTLTIEMFDGV